MMYKRAGSLPYYCFTRGPNYDTPGSFSHAINRVFAKVWLEEIAFLPMKNKKSLPIMTLVLGN